jgi:hypothetical protein
VEAYCIADDGFEFFGGTVNTKYLVSAFCDDDMFDTDQGYRGTNQFWFGIQAPDKRNFGMELNNQVNEVATTNRLLPAADFKVYNLTLIGCGAGVTNVNGGNDAGLILRPYVAPKIYNAIFTDFNERGVQLDTQNGVNADVSVTNGLAQFHNTLWWDFAVGSGSGTINNSITNLSRNTVASNYWTDASLTNQISNPMLTSISRTNIGATLDPRPKAGSPAYSDAAPTPNDGFLTPTAYRGAFGPGRSQWLCDWTALGEYSITGGAGGINPLQVTTPTAVPPPAQPTLSIVQNGPNVDISFPTQSGYLYQLQTNTAISSAWGNYGLPIPGGSSALISVPTGAAELYFRVLAY